jgi:hypothetical protein
MHKRLLSFFLSSIFLGIPLMTYAFVDKKMMVGIIQFPKAVQKIPSIRVYCGGKRILCEPDNETKRLVFSLSEKKYQTYFYLLIAKEIDVQAEENTIQYLKIKPGEPYKLYALELVVNPHKNGVWVIKEVLLPSDTGRIPDETIIVYYDPAYFSGLSGGNEVEFPKLLVKNDIIDMVGSELELHDISNKMLVSSLRYDPLHEHIKYIVKQDFNLKKVIALER